MVKVRYSLSREARTLEPHKARNLRQDFPVRHPGTGSWHAPSAIQAHTYLDLILHGPSQSHWVSRRTNDDSIASSVSFSQTSDGTNRTKRQYRSIYKVESKSYYSSTRSSLLSPSSPRSTLVQVLLKATTMAPSEEILGPAPLSPTPVPAATPKTVQPLDIEHAAPGRTKLRITAILVALYVSFQRHLPFC